MEDSKTFGIPEAKGLKGRPLDLFPCVGLHVTRSDTALPLARLQCPANWSLLFVIFVVTCGMLSYSSLFVMCNFQLTFSADLSILV